MSSKRILIIDDEPDMLEWLSEVLAFAGYKPITTALPAAGLVMACEQEPDAVICDINMPALSGVYVFRLLKDHPSTANIPLILMSGDAFAIAPEGVGMLAKPFQPEDLISLIEQQLSSVKPSVSDGSAR